MRDGCCKFRLTEAFIGEARANNDAYSDYARYTQRMLAMLDIKMRVVGWMCILYAEHPL